MGVVTIESSISTPHGTAPYHSRHRQKFRLAGSRNHSSDAVRHSPIVSPISLPFLQMYLHRYICIAVALYLYLHLSHPVACFIWHVWHTHKCLSLKWAADCLFFLFMHLCRSVSLFLWLSFAFRFVYPSMTTDKKHATPPPSTAIKTTTYRYKQW